MLKMIGIGLALLVTAWIGAGLAVVALAGPFEPSGRYVDIGGRKLRLVCAGPVTTRDPVIWMEAGAWGMAANFAAIQQRLADQEIRSCAYDRAGMGFSDPGPLPRDSKAIVADLHSLMNASGEQGPFVLMAHSMGGLHAQLFAGSHPEKVAGIVLLEASPPEMSRAPQAQALLQRFRVRALAVAVANSVGLSRIAYWRDDGIGLPPQGLAEKRRAYVSGRQGRTAAREVLRWREDSDQAAAVSLDPRWPVAVITAGDVAGREHWNEPRQALAKASRAGYVEHDSAAQHDSLLGLTHSDAVIRGVDHVMAALRTPSPEPS